LNFLTNMNLNFGSRTEIKEILKSKQRKFRFQTKDLNQGFLD
jgi:hypothetical protein